MSDETRGRKTLSPEMLPAPGPGAGPGPKERVAERARLWLQRFRGLGTAAGAAVLSLQCNGYGVVDPLPPPPQQCSTLADPFAKLVVDGYAPVDRDAGTAVYLRLQTASYPSYNGFRVNAVRVTGGTFGTVEDDSRNGQGGGTLIIISVVPNSADLVVEVDLGCGGAMTTKRYHVRVHSTEVTVDEITAGADASADANGDERG